MEKMHYATPVALVLTFIFVFLLGIFFVWTIGNASDGFGQNLASFQQKDKDMITSVYTNSAWAASKGCLVAFVQADNSSILTDAKKTADQKVTDIVAKYDATKLQDLNSKVATCAGKSIPASWGGAIYVNITKTVGTGDFSVENIANLLAK
ncbi:MAG: hypothetical protein COT26_01040 [Candidatus Kerfeldbacteria bacterium CG08_land_8_20_14_0_20_43_14]|uniref:Uncharacterized protein n=1 Tax=Candidatus Kerfeldbacteria bacterium CG08_land_8_20_14_0_20_43_14 TaxID=2014246 RepID=A0A2H0YQU6_9BACT|nr:MAG: hypothetical protein COT26_01040 [Candidatus Kerfeldbacteria bacterium CG08_land_8_20_14_0_20_43_14]